MQHKYICFKRFHEEGIDGTFNIRYGSELTADGKFIYYNDRIVCAERSENACKFFAINDDDKGLERSSLTSSIMSILSINDDKHDGRWFRVQNDKIARTMRRKDYDDMWLWDMPFYKASIEDLNHILNLIKEV